MDLGATIRSVVAASGLELVEMAFHHGGGRQLLRVTVDREGGVDLDSIAEVSGRIARRLDLEGFDPGPYSLEVSSPGLERPLKDPRDFARRVGEKVKVKTAQAVEGSRILIGTLVSAGDREVRIATEGGERTVAFDNITSAKTVFDWGSSARESGRRR